MSTRFFAVSTLCIGHPDTYQLLYNSDRKLLNRLPVSITR